MKHLYKKDVLRRWEGNPAITPDNLSFPCLDIRNAAAVKFDGKYMLLVTIQMLDGRSRLFLAESQNGRDFKVNPEPVLAPSDNADYFEYELNGVEDARITLLDGTYYVCYTAVSPLGDRLAIAKTEDFHSFERIGLVSEPDNKHGCLFPEKINGKYCRLERPREGGSIWASYSNDLIYWGNMRLVMGPRAGYWDYHRVGPGVPPIRIEQGWLLIYYGIKSTSAGPLFRLGAAILDAKEPTKILGRADIPVLSPEFRYERVGDVGNLVFATGGILEDRALMVYYAGADSCVCVATSDVDKIIERCLSGSGHERRVT